MIKTASFWELGWITPIKEVDYYQYPLEDFGVDEICLHPISGIKSSRIKEYNNLDEILDKNPDLTVVFISDKGKTPLSKFNHPKDVLYVTGLTSGNDPSISYARPDRPSVFIETPNNEGGMWGHQALSIVLYDRMIKDGRNG